MGDTSREMEILRKKTKEMLQIRKTVTEMRNVFEGLIHRLYTGEGRGSELQDTSRESSKTEKWKEQRFKKKKTEENILRVKQLRNAQPMCNEKVRKRIKKQKIF